MLYILTKTLTVSLGNFICSHMSAGAALGLQSKESVYSAGDPGSVPGLGRSPGEGNGNPFYQSCLGNAMDRGTW